MFTVSVRYNTDLLRNSRQKIQENEGVPSRAELVQAEPSRADPIPAEQSRGEPSRGGPSFAEPSRAEPRRPQNHLLNQFVASVIIRHISTLRLRKFRPKVILL